MLHKTTPLALGLGALVAQPTLGASFFDDYSSDTSANYIGTTTYGGGGSFDVTGGTLNLTATGTFNVFHSTANLEAGEFASVDLPTTQNDEVYFTVSTTTRGPNTGTQDGIRFLVLPGGDFRSRIYNNGTQTTSTYDTNLADSAVTLYILRNTDSNFSVGYDIGGGLVTLETYDVAAVGTQDLFIGVEAFSTSESFDNLTIGSIADIPEPGSLALLALSGLALLRRRRA